MYSHEIDNIMKTSNHSIPASVYSKICSGSSQIREVKYDPYSCYFEIWTNDDWYWTFTVYID